MNLPEAEQIVVDAILAYDGELKREEVTPNVEIESLGFDSLDTIELVRIFEEKFAISINDTDVDKFRTVDDVAKALCKVLQDKEAKQIV